MLLLRTYLTMAYTRTVREASTRAVRRARASAATHHEARLADERQAAREQLVREDARGPEVGLLRVLHLEHLGRDVDGRACALAQRLVRPAAAAQP